MPDAPASPAPASTKASSSSGFQLRDLLSFEKMIVPKLVKITYYALCILAIIAGAVLLINGAGSRYGGGVQVLSGISMIVFGPLAIRIACEQIIVLFGIYDRLGEIRDQNHNRSDER